MFAKAWSQGMTVSNITSGFRTTGVYPFNPKAVLDKVPHSEASSNSGPFKNIALSPQLIQKYEKKFENKYKIYTHKGYVQWLREAHPDSGKMIISLFNHCRKTLFIV